MRRGYVVTGVLTAVAAIVLCAVGTQVVAQDHGVTPAEIERGGQVFLASCATCHGPDGDGVTGVNLASGQFRHGVTDQDLINIIRNGIPGTPMPPSNLQEAQAGLVVAYLRSLPATLRASRTTGMRGNAANGKALVDSRGACLTCHRIQTADGLTGGFLGPELSGIGLARRSIELERALTDPSADIRIDNRSARVITKDGVTITGRLLNQDTYSLQLLEGQGKLMSFQKNAVRSWEILEISLMPSFADKFSTQELADVVTYLTTLRTPAPASGGGAGRGGRGRGAF